MIPEGCGLQLRRGDITQIRADAIVNAANEHLRGGGGVDGAIHSRGGPIILEECRRIGHCATGNAVATSAGALPARWVIHAVAPRWTGGARGEVDLLRSAYVHSLQVAEQLGARSVAFPSLGTGAYAYPVAQAASIAVAAVQGYLQGNTGIREVTFVLFSDSDLRVYQDALSGLR